MISNGSTLTILTAFLAFVLGSPCEMINENLQEILPILTSDDFPCLGTKMRKSNFLNNLMMFKYLFCRKWCVNSANHSNFHWILLCQFCFT